MRVGDLVYIPSDVKLLQFHENIEHIDPEKTYVGPSPIRVCTLEKPTNLLLIDLGKNGEKYVKVLYDGTEWYVEKQDVSKNVF